MVATAGATPDPDASIAAVDAGATRGDNNQWQASLELAHDPALPEAGDSHRRTDRPHSRVRSNKLGEQSGRRGTPAPRRSQKPPTGVLARRAIPNASGREESLRNLTTAILSPL